MPGLIGHPVYEYFFYHLDSREACPRENKETRGSDMQGYNAFTEYLLVAACRDALSLCSICNYA